MRRILSILALLIGCGSLLVRAAEPPRLVVVLVIDQFRADYLTTFSSHWRAGFKTLLSEGAHFRRAQYPYLYTDTCAGHATISTGTLPRRHGMVADNWWDTTVRANVECTADSSAKIVTYGRPATVGKSAKRLLAPTLAERLREQRPDTRVVTLSLKARSAITLAGHSGDAVTWFEDAAGTFLTSSAYASAPVPMVKQFIDASPFDQALNSTWTLRDAPGTYRNRDAGLGERPPGGWTGLFPHVLKGEKGADETFFGQWRRSPTADAYIGRMATALVDAYSLGQRDSTDFLAVSFSALDYIGHAFGPDSRELEDAVARMDDVIGDLITHLDARVGRANYVLALSADHGVATVPSASVGTGRVVPQDVRERIEDTLSTRDRSPNSNQYVDGMNAWNIYLSEAGRRVLASDPGAIRAVQEAVLAIPGVSQVLHASALSGSSPDPIARAGWLSRFPDRSGEFLVVIKRNWTAGGRPEGDAAAHGTPYDYDQRVPILFLGAGVKRGVYDTPSSPADIAPTLAALAGVSLPGVDGRVLREALVAPSTSTR